MANTIPRPLPSLGMFDRKILSASRRTILVSKRNKGSDDLISGLRRRFPLDSRAIDSNAITTRLYLPDYPQPETGCSSAWPEHCVRDAGVAGSNPVTPIFSVHLLHKSAATANTASASPLLRSRLDGAASVNRLHKFFAFAAGEGQGTIHEGATL